MLCGELSESLEVDVALIVLTDWKDVADLRPNAGYPRLKATDAVAHSTVAGDLVEEIPNQTDLPLLGHEL
jgi:hypothetical protein